MSNREAVARYRQKNGKKVREASRAAYVRDSAAALIRTRTRAGMVNPPGGSPAGPCEICGRLSEKLDCDHNHATGAFRGWLCRRCNVRMAALDDRVWVEKAEAYRVKDR